MYIDDLIFSKREFLRELKALCKKWNVTIYGCGCCGSPLVEFEDECMEDLYVSGEMLYITTGDRRTAYLTNSKHDIEVMEDVVSLDRDSNYSFPIYKATCKKCGMSGHGYSEISARESLECQECK